MKSTYFVIVTELGEQNGLALSKEKTLSENRPGDWRVPDTSLDTVQTTVIVLQLFGLIRLEETNYERRELAVTLTDVSGRVRQQSWWEEGGGRWEPSAEALEATQLSLSRD